MNPVINIVNSLPVKGKVGSDKLGGRDAEDLSFSSQLKEKVAAVHPLHSNAVAKAIDKSTGHKTLSNKVDKGDKESLLLSLLQGMLHNGTLIDGTPLTAEQMKHVQQMIEQLEKSNPPQGTVSLLSKLTTENAGDFHAGEGQGGGRVDLTLISDKIKQTLVGMERPRTFTVMNLHKNSSGNTLSVPQQQEKTQGKDAESDLRAGSLMGSTATASGLEASLGAPALTKQVFPEQPTVSHREEPTDQLPVAVPMIQTNSAIDGGTMQLASSSGVVSATIEPSLGSLAWQQAINQHVALFVREGISKAELQLHPAELGALKINLNINNDVAQLHFASGHQQVREIIESALPHLRTSLAEAGIQLGQSSVGAEGSSSSWEQSASSAQHAREVAEESSISSDMEETVPLPVRSVSLLGGVDTFA